MNWPKFQNLTASCATYRYFDLNSALHDIDDDLDVATFNISEQQLAEIDNAFVDCRYCWPPPEPQQGKLVAAAGFPKYLFAPDETFRVNRDNVFSMVTPMRKLKRSRDLPLL